ncbi:type VI secretion system membrane subunit TssM [Massilia endophytica]|uniref:type VI secretion system membrane subunit TssM n=1 Tax=Massilia endophytica TaxID=2899220 RepID=UPI001E4EAC18|nr:type VI secretion system membrane subunit TssM [Massilia endophytica]UGQ44837.1 type VI secretion system membrane subunit TssM [Massilia endophytica]
MFRRIWLFATDTRRLTIAGLFLMVAAFYLGAEILDIALIWAAALSAVLLLGWLLVWWLRRRSAQASAAALEKAIVEPDPAQLAEANSRKDVEIVRDGVLKAIATIKGSRLGVVSGRRALYELPWYMVIGNPSAGKSSAITHSGLQFPFADSKVVQGIGGTRNCDWFFTSEGILLDTAGRYAVQDEHRAEWHGFLDLLKKHRSRAPVNGLIIAVSIAELRSGDPDGAIRLARSLRKRVQDLIEHLEVFAPVYVMFTKVDLVAGFGDFFAQSERSERERVWGATMPYQRKAGSKEVLAFFDQAFDELHEGLKETSIANMTQQGRERMPAGVFTFPMEFAALKVPLRAFLATLFEDNPFQFKPVFRGFYFTSALQEGHAECVQSRRVADRFQLRMQEAQDKAPGETGYFLLSLFRKVIFADRDLVRQYASPYRIRLQYAALFCGVLLLGSALAGWTWSYLGNRQLLSNVQADLDKAVRLQKGRIDLQSRLEALVLLQDRAEQLHGYRDGKPWQLGFGLYQGAALERMLDREYFAGMREVMLKPVAAALEAKLHEAAGDGSEPLTPGRAEETYNALKAYLMLADTGHAEPGHLNDQLARYWRTWLEANRGAMPREQMIRSAERLMAFYLAHVGEPGWPVIENKLALVDAARERLRQVVRGMPARERVYAEIRARASTRYPAMTVARMVGEQDKALVLGSHAVPGAFTREAWQGYVEGAIRDAANKELQSADWVLNAASKEDLTLEGSPEQIQKGLVEMYKNDYTREWRKFVQGVSIAGMDGFPGAVAAMNRLGDPQFSPIAKVLEAVHLQTSWDNPAALNAQMKQAQTGFLNWVKANVLRMTPSPVNGNVNVNIQLDSGRLERPVGPIGREFAGLGKLLGTGDSQATLMKSYMEALSRLRTRLNLLKNQGDPGPGARQLMQQTLEGSGSELADALKLVDEQMLTGMSDSQRQALRPLLVRPLMQVFAVIVNPAEAELNRTWQAQVVEPFKRTLASKYPFDGNARMEASAAEIAQIFGPSGQVAKFVDTAMGALVVRRGDTLTPRTWADMGISLQPEAVQQFAGWISATGANAQASAQTVFQILPSPAPNTLEYTVEIDGQVLRYRNTPAQWTSMTHPGPQGVAGARISAVGFDGRSVELFNEPGQSGLGRLIEAAAKTKKANGVHELRWSGGGMTVALDLRIISNPAASADSGPQDQGFRNMRLPDRIVGSTRPSELAAAGSAAGGSP